MSLPGQGFFVLPQTALTDRAQWRYGMAKGQKRGNREARKPKTSKQPAAQAMSTLLPKGTLVPLTVPKKKG